MIKSERLYLRITPRDKLFLKDVADKYHKGDVSKLFNNFLEQLKADVYQELQGGTEYAEEN